MNKLGNMHFNFSKCDTPITIHETKSVVENGIPKKPKKVKFLETWAHVETVFIKDFETARQNNTLTNVKLFIRDYPNVTNKMQIDIHGHADTYKVENVLPNYRNSGFTYIDAKVVSV